MNKLYILAVAAVLVVALFEETEGIGYRKKGCVTVRRSCGVISACMFKTCDDGFVCATCNCQASCEPKSDYVDDDDGPIVG